MSSGGGPCRRSPDGRTDQVEGSTTGSNPKYEYYSGITGDRPTGMVADGKE